MQKKIIDLILVIVELSRIFYSKAFNVYEIDFFLMDNGCHANMQDPLDVGDFYRKFIVMKAALDM